MIPYPYRAEFGNSCFTLTDETKISFPNELVSIAKYLQELISTSTGFNLQLSKEIAKINTINLVLLNSSEQLNSEGYQLLINQENIVINATAPQGIFHGVQTLRQLFPIEIERREIIKEIVWSVPCASILDNPRFAWRGLMFDVGRHFHDVDTIKKTLDLLALLKMNVFHWHLTEDQGWRIEIKKYPKLTEIGSKRKDTKIGGWTSKRYRGEPHEGYYTQDQIREVVQYANDRYITIIPEIEIPGHSSAAIAAYPELSCKGKNISVPTKFGIFKEIFCPGKETTFKFFENVLEEVIGLFPSKIIHIGGDEVPKEKWKQCPDCQKRMKDEGLDTEHKLQQYTTARIGKFLESKGRRLMGWNEILAKKTNRSFIAQWWLRGKKEIKKHVREGGEIVVSKFFHVYLDYNYLVTSLRKTYSHEPIFTNIKQEHVKQILGVEATIWTEWVPNRERLDWQLFPRLLAIAELGWTSKKNKNYKNFKKRLKQFSQRLDYLGVKYANLEEVDPSLFKRVWNWRRTFKWPEI